MIGAVAILLVAQLAGETLARGLGLAVPGPVIGLALLFAALRLRPELIQRLRPVTETLLGNLSLLFVPAGVGVVAHLETLGADGPALLAALVASTALAILAGVGAFLAVKRVIGDG